MQSQSRKRGGLSMKTKCLAVTADLAIGWAALVVAVNADEESRNQLRATLKGFNETPANSPPASGSFRATVSGDSITFELKYSGLVADSLFAHIHLGQKNVAGGVMISFCNNSNPSPSPRTCPPRGATAPGTVTPTALIGPNTQAIAQ